eukprot:CAMPEP_0172885192 /NCGR_PEP_ID=MMETSP1075-20121228/127326_1 /TAXON_ID=2916 /ORGANISM="Ceratium fusus, Strain PA161109" /LENGTH=70 /DNA_ID=CAMNT_0013738423 /DNA_START=10 /DNA_END=222 /DNA_ORIENTATION=-
MTPPTLGSMTLRISDSFISDCPTIAENGNTGLASFAWVASATARRAALCGLFARRASNPPPVTRRIPPAV